LKCVPSSHIIPYRTPDPDIFAWKMRAAPVEPAAGQIFDEGAPPMATVDKLPMLAEGYDMLTADLQRLKAERPQVIDAIEEARAHGDLSENAEYHAAKERQGQIEAMIADIEDRLSRAQVIDPSTLSGDKIVFGATVTLRDEDDKPVKYQIVGQTEADAKTGKISYNSPLGRALIGRRLDDEVEVTVPSGDRYYVVAKIEFI
jgi:transcription elongation factor GreA